MAQFPRGDPSPAPWKFVHQSGAPVLGEGRPGRDFLQCAEAAQAQAALTVDDADLDAGSGDRAARGRWRVHGRFERGFRGRVLAVKVTSKLSYPKNCNIAKPSCIRGKMTQV